MFNKKGKYFEIIIHAFCWIVLTFLFIHFNALSFHYLRGDVMDIPLIFGTLVNAFLFYINLFFLFPKYTLSKFSSLQYIFWIVFLSIIFSVVENVFDYFYAVRYFPKKTVIIQSEELIVTTVVNLSFLIASFLYAAVKMWIKNEVTKRILTEENLKLELNYLKSQISPHFLFNSLNNLYSIAIKNEDNETAKGLSKLSTLMRFMLDKSDKTEVKLSEEIEYLRSYIELQKLRFLDDDDLVITFDVVGELGNFNIPPFLLINFVENAFKHGVDYKLSSEINIYLAVEENTMTFTIENTKHPSKKIKETSRIGLENVKKRLDLIYGLNYELDIKSEVSKYTVKLKIKNLND